MPYKLNGKELDEETENYYYGARYYDPKSSMWLSVDPLTNKYPWYSPYQFAGNKPIWATDLDGKEERYHTFDLNINNRGKIQVNNFREIKNKRAGYFYERTSYGYGSSFKTRHEPTGQFGPGTQYNINVHLQNGNGQWEDRSLSYFAPRETFFKKLGFKTQKEGTREGGIIFSSKQPYAGRENYLNPTAKHPDPYIVPIDEIISGFSATSAAAKDAPTNIVEFFNRMVDAFGLRQDIGEQVEKLPLNKEVIIHRKKVIYTNTGKGFGGTISTTESRFNEDTNIITHIRYKKRK